jgi:hypothetical protein
MEGYDRLDKFPYKLGIYLSSFYNKSILISI